LPSRHGLIDTIIGLYHFLGDRAPGDADMVSPKPRKVNPFAEDGVPLIGMVQAGDDLRSSVARCIELIGGLGKAVSPGDRVVVKPNYNSPDLFPGSTDIEFLKGVVGLLKDAGARVTVGESSGGIWRPTRKVLEKMRVFRALDDMGVDMIVFEERADDWVKVSIGGDYLYEVTVPRSMYEADRIVYLPCMKTHKYARFSLSLKLGVGFVHPGERRSLHLSNLERKVAEINLVWQPDLIIMDGRKAFISGGPEKGEVVEPGIILTSGDLVAMDVEALKTLGSYEARNKLLPNPYDSPQVATALKHGLGSEEYRVVT